MINDKTATVQDINDIFMELTGPATVKTMEDSSRDYQYGACPIGGGLFSNRRQRLNDMRDWCSLNLGKKEYGEYRAGSWQFSNDHFWFKSEEDRMAFVLRWA